MVAEGEGGVSMGNKLRYPHLRVNSDVAKKVTAAESLAYPSADAERHDAFGTLWELRQVGLRLHQLPDEELRFLECLWVQREEPGTELRPRRDPVSTVPVHRQTLYTRSLVGVAPFSRKSFACQHVEPIERSDGVAYRTDFAHDDGESIRIEVAQEHPADAP